MGPKHSERFFGLSRIEHLGYRRGSCSWEFKIEKPTMLCEYNRGTLEIVDCVRLQHFPIEIPVLFLRYPPLLVVDDPTALSHAAGKYLSLTTCTECAAGRAWA
jgi:hypothetical protein